MFSKDSCVDPFMGEKVRKQHKNTRTPSATMSEHCKINWQSNKTDSNRRQFPHIHHVTSNFLVMFNSNTFKQRQKSLRTTFQRTCRPDNGISEVKVPLMWNCIKLPSISRVPHSLEYRDIQHRTCTPEITTTQDFTLVRGTRPRNAYRAYCSCETA